MVNHGVYVSKRIPGPSIPVAAESGIPFVVGAAPVQCATSPVKAGVPVICETWDDVLRLLGYSDDWKAYNLCEFAYSHFKLYGCKPVAFCNLLDPATMKAEVPAADLPVTDHQIKLPIGAINDAALVIKAEGGGDAAYVVNTDYIASYVGESLVITLLEGGKGYAASTLNVAYSKVSPEKVTAEVVAAGVEASELCMAATGCAPDLLCAPGYSSDPAVAAALALKASGINGMFRAKALIDIDCSSDGATDLDAAISKKTEGLTDLRMIPCWPMMLKDGKMYHMSTHLAGVMTRTDAANDGCPYESPSSKAMVCDAMVLESGEEVMLSHPQANKLNANGIVTALSFLGRWVVWGNYTAAYPKSKAVDDCFIPVSRMFDWIGNNLVRTFWANLDTPVNRRLIDNIVDAANIWLNGLVGAGYLYGARVEVPQDENTQENLMQGIVKLRIFIASPSPAQEIGITLEFDSSYVHTAMQM